MSNTIMRPSLRTILVRPARQYSSSAGPSGFKINADRLQESIHNTCKWGAAHRYGSGPNQTGMCRLSLTDNDARARQWFHEETKNLGCAVSVDKMGNMFARQNGSLGSPAPMTAMGSHLDTQPRGGRYDGILGVMAAIEVLRTLKENGHQTQYDLGVVNWTNEEGARFPKSMLASGVWAGDIPLQKAWDLGDIFNPQITLKSELERLGYLGEVECSDQGYPLAAHFELHIEQGPELEDAGKRIGVVQGAQAYRWLTVSVVGRDAHTGTTPYSARKDPLLAAARMIAASSDIGRENGALVTTGVISIPPTSSTNTIAASTSFTLDIRHPEDEIVALTQEKCIDKLSSLSAKDGQGISFSWNVDTKSPSVKFDRTCIQAVQDAAVSLVGADGWMPITSGAGHDTVYTSRRCPSTMIFVPCKDGVSHHPEEYCSPEDCAIGAQTLLEAVLRYDSLRAAKSA
jgi:hydantoinase/carbamoylase family amidase